MVWVDDDADSDLDLMVDGKRSRKQRITMVAARGSGYGGDIPTLLRVGAGRHPRCCRPSADGRQPLRDWAHQDFCCLCAKRRVRESDNLLRCVHCPKIFHEPAWRASTGRSRPWASSARITSARSAAGAPLPRAGCCSAAWTASPATAKTACRTRRWSPRALQGPGGATPREEPTHQVLALLRGRGVEAKGCMEMR